MEAPTGATSALVFGRFTVLSQRRELLIDGVPAEIGSRAFDILLALIEVRGEILGKDDLIRLAWPGRIVEDNNLQVQIAALRRILADDRELIRTVPGRGYQFTGEVRTVAPPTEPTALATNLSAPVTELIGREDEVQLVLGLAAQHRLVTLAGVGGIGKTRLGLECARQLLPRFFDGVWVAELGPLSDPDLVPVTVASTLGLTLTSAMLKTEHLAASLGSRQVLIVLDNCEHVIEAAARVAEALLRATPAACVLATSREPLRVPGEAVYRVPALGLPDADQNDRDALLRSGAVRLFMARARDAEPQFSPDKRVAAIGAICRQLDGIPLAIELAAARSSALGVEALAARLDNRFKLLTGGRRTALPRHQTLRATLDWSYDLLPTDERVVLRRLAVFAGSFTLESAGAVATGAGIAESDVIDYVSNLVTKSLITSDVSRTDMHYRLLETTRAYAREKLIQNGEYEPFARRHADYYQLLFDRAETEWETRPSTDWLATYGREIDNVRVALDWAFSPRGDTDVGIALTIAAIPLWMHLSLIEECRDRIQQTLGGLAIDARLPQRDELRLYTALGWSLVYTTGPVRETGAAWAHALELAEELDDTEYRLRALWGLWIYHLSSGETRTSLESARRFAELAAQEEHASESFVGDRLIGVSQHYLGDQSDARERLERVLDGYVAPAHRSHTIRFQYDQRIAAEATLVRVLWLQGFPDQALATARRAVEEAQPLHHALSLALALEAACLVELFAGDLAAAERSRILLLDHATRHAIGRWYAWSRCFEGVLRARQGDVDVALRLLRNGLDELRKSRFALFHVKFLGDLGEVLAQAGEIPRALEAIDEALTCSARNDEGWCLPELLRIKGELLVLEESPSGALEAQRLFAEALERARSGGALAWELRIAMSQARLLQRNEQSEAARGALHPILDRFTEGFETADLRAASELLAALSRT